MKKIVSLILFATAAVVLSAVATPTTKIIVPAQVKSQCCDWPPPPPDCPPDCSGSTMK